MRKTLRIKTRLLLTVGFVAAMLAASSGVALWRLNAISQGVDQVMRGVTGMGPQRHRADADKPEQTIGQLEKDLAIDQKMYLPFDPVRKRALMVAFPNGTKNLEGVRKIVDRFKDVVMYWEPRNEPNFGKNGMEKAVNFVNNELKPFYEREVFGRVAMFFEGRNPEELAPLGELRTPSVADLFVAKMQGVS